MIGSPRIGIDTVRRERNEKREEVDDEVGLGSSRLEIESSSMACDGEILWLRWRQCRGGGEKERRRNMAMA